MSMLDEQERKYAQNPRTHIDFVVYHKMDKKPRLAIEIDGYAFHNAKNAQSKRDELKNAILARYDFTLLRLSTIGSGDEKRIINALMDILFLINTLTQAKTTRIYHKISLSISKNTPRFFCYHLSL